MPTLKAFRAMEVQDKIGLYCMKKVSMLVLI